MTEELSGRRIVVPETRELGQLLRMLEDRGADTVPCPMIAIRDAPDIAPVEAWLRRFGKGACDDLVLMTGEGLRRLLGFARRLDLEATFPYRAGLCSRRCHRVLQAEAARIRLLDRDEQRRSRILPWRGRRAPGH